MANKAGIHGDLRRFVDLCYDFQRQDMDIVLPVSSRKGMGKTTDGLQIVRDYFKRYLGVSSKHQFIRRMPKLIAYSNAQVAQRIDEAEDSTPLLLDEAVRFAMGEDWSKRENREMKKKFTQIRDKHLILIMCIPDFWWLDRKYREDMVVFWTHNMMRGYGMVFTPDMKIGIKDCWHRDKFEAIKRPFNMFTNPQEIINIYEKHPCYFGYMHVSKVDQDIYNEYLKLRKAAVWNEEMETEDRMNKWKAGRTCYDNLAKKEFTDELSDLLIKEKRPPQEFVYRLCGYDQYTSLATFKARMTDAADNSKSDDNNEDNHINN